MTTGWQNRIVRHGTEQPDQLLTNPRNWRLHPKQQQEALTGLLDRVGWVQDVIVNQRTGHVVDGHLRVGIAISRGEKEIPVVYVDLSEEDEALVLASLDPLAAMAVADEDMLAELLGGIEADGALGEMLAELSGNSGPKQGRTHPDVVPNLPDEPTTKRGDLWQLGGHRLLCGDATNDRDVARVLNGERAVMMWTDPPYGVSYVGKTKDALTIENDVDIGLDDLLESAFRGALQALEPGAPFYISRPAGPTGAVFLQKIIAVLGGYHEELQWVKDSMVLGHSDYHIQHETIVYGWVPGPGRSGRGKHEGSRWYGDNAQTSVMEVPRPKASQEHPTMKPVELIEIHLRNSSPQGGLIYEPFSGSGSTLLACERLGRRCCAIELNPAYVDVAIKRWEDFTGERAVKGDGD